jgi:glutamate transport system permease protein
MRPRPDALFEVPGPRARLRNNAVTLLVVSAMLGLGYLLYGKLDAKGQWDSALWKPFLDSRVWTGLLLPGLLGTLTATVVSAVLALAFGAAFGMGRLSGNRWISLPAGATVEFCRAIPLLIMIFLLQAGSFAVLGSSFSAFTSVVVGLTLYNGSVLAEIFRAGVRSVPKGQGEAAYAIGLRTSQVMRHILLPQAITAMMPAIVGQLVVLLKDTALGWIVAYEDLLNAGIRLIPATFSNLIPAAMVIAMIYMVLNIGLSRLAVRLERRNTRRSASVVTAPLPRGLIETARLPTAVAR